MTRSHHQSRSDSHRWRTDLNEEVMVLPYSKRVPPKSFVRSRSGKPRFSRSRPARTPPSTFLFLHLHLSNSPGPERSHPPRWRVPTPLHRRRPTNRLGSVVESLIKVRSIKGAKACLGLVGQCSAALSGRVIGPPHRRCQRVLSTNRRTAEDSLQCEKCWRFP